MAFFTENEVNNSSDSEEEEEEISDLRFIPEDKGACKSLLLIFKDDLQEAGPLQYVTDTPQLVNMQYYDRVVFPFIFSYFVGERDKFT